MDKIRQADQHPAFHAIVGLITIPLAVWEWYAIGDLLTASKLRVSTLLPHAAVSLILTKLLVASFLKFNFYLRAGSLGCGTVAVYPHKDPILGLDLLLQALPRLKSHSGIQWISERMAKYGNTHFHLTLGGEWVIVTNEPENIKAILSANFDDWLIGGPRLLATLPILGENSIFSTNGEAWRHNRAVLRPSFVRDQVADLACFTKHTTNMIKRIPTDGSTFDIQELLQRMTMDSASDFLFGHSTNMLTDHPEPGAAEFARAFDLANEECANKARISPILLKFPHKRLDANVKIERDFIRAYLRKAVADRKERVARGEQPKKRGYVFLDELLDGNHPEDYLMDQLLSVILAGRDTTAMAISTAIWYLARNPTCVAKLRDEISNLGTRDPTWEEIKNMKYLNNIIKEGLRLLPPTATNSRTANKDTVLPRGGGPDGKQPILLCKNQAVRWSTASMQRRRYIFGPDADVFRPERWEEKGFRPGSNWEYLPFSGGPRVCPGQQFALTQVSYVLLRLFQTFKAVEARDHDEIRLLPSLTVSFALGCKVAFTPA